jgi:hypothetical protein
MISRRARSSSLLVVGLIVLTGSCQSPAAEDAMLPARFRKLVPLAKPLGPPQPGEWREAHPEPAESLEAMGQGKGGD